MKKSNSNLNPIRYFNELSNMTCYYPLSMTNYFESNIDKNVKSLTKQFKPDKLKYIIITNTYMWYYTNYTLYIKIIHIDMYVYI